MQAFGWGQRGILFPLFPLLRFVMNTRCVLCVPDDLDPLHVIDYEGICFHEERTSIGAKENIRKINYVAKLPFPKTIPRNPSRGSQGASSGFSPLHPSRYPRAYAWTSLLRFLRATSMME